jgi:ubiquinone/menaquinone biosynthesis C-methylase UbiE
MSKISTQDYQRLVEETFDSIAEAYVAAEDTEECRAFSEEMLAMLGDVGGTKVLDAGCGFGQQAALLLKCGAQVTGVDISQKLIDFAQQRAGHHELSLFIKANILDYLASSKIRFDTIISFFELMYHDDIEKMMRLFNLTMNDGGSLLVLVPHPVRNMGMHNPPDYFSTGLHEENWRVGRIFKYYFPLCDYINALTENGFRILRMVEPVPPKEKVTFYDAGIVFPKETRYPQALAILCQKDNHVEQCRW